MYAYAKLIMHNATKIMVAHDHIINPPKFDGAMISEMNNKALLSAIPKPTLLMAYANEGYCFSTILKVKLLNTIPLQLKRVIS